MKKDRFPKQARVLYQFLIDAENQFVRTGHSRYDIIPDTISGTKYRIYTRNGIKSKTSEQLDKVLNNSLWTFDPDFQAALEKFEKRSESDLIHAETMLESAKEFRRSVTLLACADTFHDAGDEWPD